MSYITLTFCQIKPKEINEKDVTTTTIEKEDRDTKNEIKVKLEIETEEKFEEKNEIEFVPEIARPTNDVITKIQEEIHIEPPIVEIIERTKVTAEEAENLVAKEIIDSSELHND